MFLDGLLGKKLKVRAGEPIDVKIPMSGAPQPKVTWAKANKKIEASKRTTVSHLCIYDKPFRYKNIKILKISIFPLNDLFFLID